MIPSFGFHNIWFQLKLFSSKVVGSFWAGQEVEDWMRWFLLEKFLSQTFYQKTTKSSSESRHLRYFKIISKNYVLYHFPVALMHAHTNYNFHSLSISKRIRKNGKVFLHRPTTLRSEWLKWVTWSVEIDSCSRNPLNGFTWNCISQRFGFFDILIFIKVVLESA